MPKTLVYIEYDILKDFKTKQILKKINNPFIIKIKKYSDIFNRPQQDFRTQKELGKSLIIAKKRESFIQKNPPYCLSHIKNSYYCSPVLNCPFDCEYCFLQGMYRCAYLLIFINNYDFLKEIEKIIQTKKTATLFFVGYNTDLLAVNYLVSYVEEYCQFIPKYPQIQIEIRTKSAQINSFKNLNPHKNILISWTLSPTEITQQYEKNTPSLLQRLQVIQKLQQQGWKIGLRFDPIIYVQNWEEVYEKFFETLEKKLDFAKIENIYFDFFKVPKPFFKKMKKNYPKSKLFHIFLEEEQDQQLTYEKNLKSKMLKFFIKKTSQLLSKDKVYFFPEKKS